jgi:hypothetical protein
MQLFLFDNSSSGKIKSLTNSVSGDKATFNRMREGPPSYAKKVDKQGPNNETTSGTLDPNMHSIILQPRSDAFKCPVIDWRYLVIF